MMSIHWLQQTAAAILVLVSSQSLSAAAAAEPCLFGERGCSGVRFFTMAWWCGCQTGDTGDPSADYAAHLTAIRDRIPADLLALQESVSLHDGRLRELGYSPATGMLRMLIDGDDGAGGLRRFTLTYRDVTLFRSFADPDKGLPGPHGFGDLGYYEADVAESGELVHRILFSSGIEFIVQFTGFELAWQDIAEQGVPPDHGGIT